MNKRIAPAVALASSLLLGPAALAATEPPSTPALELGSADVLDHREDHHGKDGKDGKHNHGKGGKDDHDDHDHDGDGRPDHAPEDHDDDDD